MTQTPRQAHRVYTSVRAQPRYLGGNGKDEANVRLPARALGPTEEQGSYHSTCKEEEGSQGARLIGFLLGNLERAISPPGGMHVPGRPAALPRRSKYLGPAGSSERGRLCTQELTPGEPLEGRHWCSQTHTNNCSRRKDTETTF